MIGCGKHKDFMAKDGDAYCKEVTQYWPYYDSKIKAEMHAIEYAHKNNVELVCLRPTMMFGPRDLRFRSTHTLLSFLDRKVPFIPSGGVSFVDVRDVAQSFVAAMELKEALGQTYLLGAKNYTLYEFFTNLEALTGVKKPLLTVSAPVARTGAVVLDFLNRKVRGKWEASIDPVRAEMAGCFWYINSDKAKKELAFRPRSPNETLRDTLKWMVANREKYGHPPKRPNKIPSKL